MGVKRDVANLVDHEQRDERQAAQLGLEVVLAFGFGEAGDPFGRGLKLDALAGEARADRERDRQVRLAGPRAEELAAVRDAIAVDQVVLVLLDAPAEVVAARIDAREPDGWPGKQRLMEHARHLAVSMRDLAGIDIHIDTADRAAGDVAAELRAALRRYGVAA